jgi:uncharacterized protein YndB with AHSA1/START domain
MKREVQYTLYIGKPAHDVWNALTQKETIDRYYMVPVREWELVAGGKISYGTTSDMISGRFVEVQAPYKLVHTFHFVGSKDPETTVTYEITAIGESMCALSISHTGFETENQTFADVSSGWPVIASSMKSLLETGEVLPWPQDGSSTN